MNLRKKGILSLVIFLSLIFIFSQGVTANQVTFRASTTGARGDTQAYTMQYMADLIYERSDGEISMDNFFDGALVGGSGTTQTEMVRGGEIQMEQAASIVYSSDLPEWNLVMLPFMFENPAIANQFYQNAPVIDELLEGTERVGLKSIAIWPRSHRSIANNQRLVTSPEDAAGLRLRVPEIALWQDYFAEIGVDATPMAFGEVYTALELGTVDGQENAMDNMLQNAFHEVQDYITLVDYTTDALVISFNKDFWESLSEEHQMIIQNAAVDASHYKFSLDFKANRSAVIEMAQGGMEFYTPTEEEYEAFKNAAKPVWRKYEDIIGREAIADALEFLGRDPNWYLE